MAEKRNYVVIKTSTIPKSIPINEAAEIAGVTVNKINADIFRGKITFGYSFDENQFTEVLKDDPKHGQRLVVLDKVWKGYLREIKK